MGDGMRLNEFDKDGWVNCVGEKEIRWGHFGVMYVLGLGQM